MMSSGWRGLSLPVCGGVVLSSAAMGVEDARSSVLL
jgi:hypothetical protein